VKHHEPNRASFGADRISHDGSAFREDWEVGFVMAVCLKPGDNRTFVKQLRTSALNLLHPISSGLHPLAIQTQGRWTMAGNTFKLKTGTIGYSF
jgi:hypothetical protein